MNTKQLDVERIERDLGALAKHKAGFENPQALAAELEVLLDLQCVLEFAHPNGDTMVARVLALREVLTRVIDRVTNSNTQREASIYFFIDSEFTQSSLADRRAAISNVLGIRSDSYRFGQEQRLRGVIAGELMRFELETLGYAPPLLAEDAPVASSPRQGVIRNVATAVAGEYRPGEDLAPLASLVLPERPAFYDAMVDLTLSDVPTSSGHYAYDLSLTFSAELTEYVVAFVDRPGLCDLVLSHCPSITDVYSCSDRPSRELKATEIADSIDAVTLIEKTTAGTTRERPLRLEKVDEEAYDGYLEHLAAAHRDSTALFHAEIPESTGNVRLRVRQKLELEKVDHFCYWVADRPTYVRRIDLDYSQFSTTDPDRNRIVTVQPFLMTGAAQDVLNDSPHITLPIENWMIRGQGLAIVW